MIKKIVVIITLLCMVNVSYGQKKSRKKGAKTIPMKESHWTPISDNVAFITHRSVPSIQSSDDKAFKVQLNDHIFKNGTIEFDVELKGRGFPGIDFRRDQEGLNAEKFYIRYFGTLDNLKRNTVQYASVIDGVNMWDLTDDYQAAATLYENRWNHVKLVVSGKQMKVYINDMDRAVLRVPILEGITDSGTISLDGDVIYSNFVIRPNEVEGLPSSAGYDPTSNDSRYLRNWSMIESPVDFPFGKDLMRGIPRSPGVVIANGLLDSTATWKPLKADHRSLINLTKVFGATKQGERKLAWIKTKIFSSTNQEKRLDFGFSDEVWVFINGQPLYIDKNYYGAPGMKEPKGRCTIENTSFQLPLQQGENEILIGVTNYFFGWGVIARLENTEGLQFDR